MAGPQATFGWWRAPEQDGDAFMTAYAYYADWHASRALKLTLPPGHFDRLLEVYRKQGVQRSLWHRALMLYWMQEMGLPVRSLAEALSEELAAQAQSSAAVSRPAPLSSVVLAHEDGALPHALSTLLAAYVVQQTQGTLTPAAVASMEKASQRVAQANLPLGGALLLLTGKLPSTQAAAVLDKVRAESPTIDRSLTLLWTYRALSSSGGNERVLREAIAQTALAAPWQAVQTATGQNAYRWPAASALPGAIKLASTPPAGLNAVLQFDSREPETSKLPVTVQRHLYRLVSQASEASAKGQSSKARAKSRATAEPVTTVDAASFTLERLGPHAVLRTDEVYLDEVVLTHNGGAPLSFGIVEVALPPGTGADRGTWGINVAGARGEAAQALEQARFEPTPRGYAVPVDTLSGTQVIRHLVRPAQSGTFKLPPVRYYRMYQPEQKAFEDHARAQLEIR